MPVLDFLKVFAVWFVLAVVGLAVAALAVMLYLALWHHHNAAVPALGFVDCTYVVGLVGLLGLAVSPATRN
jgi:phosphate/sulfate permease